MELARAFFFDNHDNGRVQKKASIAIEFCRASTMFKFMKIKISNKAMKFIQERRIKDITFKLTELDVAGCCVGVVKDIEPEYCAPKDASGYQYIQADGYHVFISRKIRIIGPLTLTTEGFWNSKRLSLSGATVPI